MNKIINVSLKLLAICSVSALILGFVNSLTKPQIDKLENQGKINALGKLSGGGDVDPLGEVLISDHETVLSYFTITLDSGVYGYILSLKAKGYGGEMKLLASYKDDGSIINAALMANQETPGFGKEAENEGYMDNFIGLGSDLNPIPLFTYQVKDVDTVTGATITFMGISSALEKGSNFVKGGLK